MRMVAVSGERESPLFCFSVYKPSLTKSSTFKRTSFQLHVLRQNFFEMYFVAEVQMPVDEVLFRVVDARLAQLTMTSLFGLTACLVEVCWGSLCCARSSTMRKNVSFRLCSPVKKHGTLRSRPE